MDAASLALSAQSKCFASSSSSFLLPWTTVRAVGIPTSVGMTASVPYVRANGVFPVGLPGVVR